MKSETISISESTHKEIARLYNILEAESKGELIDYAIFMVSAMLDVLPEWYVHVVTKKAIEKLRDYYDSPVGINNQ